MKKIVTLVLAAAAFLSLSAQAQQDIKASTPKSAYVQDGRGVIARNPFGLCWRTGYLTKEDAVEGCDEVAKKPEETPPPAPAAAVTPPPPPPAPTSEKVTFAADAFFDFDKSDLKAEGKAKLDDLASKLGGITLEVVIAVGHTDSIGTDAYNQKLSVRRAESVKSYLISKGIDPKRVYTEGKGESQPVADNKTSDGRARNRRVEIEVVGTRTRQ
jgi:OOP family OmpA-OmpF porin